MSLGLDKATAATRMREKSRFLKAATTMNVGLIKTKSLLLRLIVGHCALPGERMREGDTKKEIQRETQRKKERG